MTKSLITHSVLPDRRYLRDAYPWHRAAAARSRHLQERAETRQLAGEALQEHQDELAQRAARAELDALVAVWEHKIRFQQCSKDLGQFVITQAAKRAGLDRDARHALKDRLFGSPCPCCGFRGCDGFCCRDDEYDYMVGTDEPPWEAGQW